MFFFCSQIKIKNVSKTIPVSLNGENIFASNGIGFVSLQDGDVLNIFGQVFQWNLIKSTRNVSRKSIGKLLRRSFRKNEDIIEDLTNEEGETVTPPTPVVTTTVVIREDKRNNISRKLARRITFNQKVC